MDLKSKALNTALTIIFTVFPGHGAAVKLPDSITSAKCSTRGGVRLISGYMGTRCCSTNASAWGVNYSIPPNKKTHDKPKRRPAWGGVGYGFPP